MTTSSAIPSQPIGECGDSVRWTDDTDPVVYTYNTDIVSLSDKLNRFIAEAGLSASANVHIMSPPDLKRFNAFLEGMRRVQAWVVTTPFLDLPATTPRKFCLAMITDVPQIESDAIRMLVRLLELTRDELIRSQSSRVTTGLNEYDSERLTANIDKIQALLDTSDLDGMDYTESAPTVPMVSSGQVQPLQV